MAGLLHQLYARSPVWVQNAAVSAYGLYWRQRRLGGDFSTEAAAFTSRDDLTAPEWRAWQQHELQRLLHHALATVPHYRELMRAAGITEAAITADAFAALAALPLLEKDTIRRSPAAFLSETPGGKLAVNHTSGTSGTPLAIHLSAATHRRVLAAYEARVRRWAGVNVTMSRAMIGGRMVAPASQTAPPFWRYNMAERQLYMSAYHIGPANVAAYAAALDRFKPDYLVGYASAHFFLARLMHEAGIRPVHAPRAILASSEKLTDEMRELLQRVYRCEVFDGYSGVEACCMASECENHRLHLSPDVGIVELLDADGQPTPPGEVGEIVATGLLNFDQPLIRYRTGDSAVMSTRACECGREMPSLERLEGRIEDTVVAPDGRETVRFHGLFTAIPAVREGQLEQLTLHEFRVRVVADDRFDEATVLDITTRLAERLGSDVHCTVERVERIERTAGGKFKAVISHVKRGDRP